MPELAELEREVSTCTRCRLAEGRTQAVFARGDPGSGLMVIGEGPGAEEDRQGLPFVGRSGQLLDRLVAEEMGLDRSQMYVTNIVRCRPPANRDPRDDEVAACTPYLDAMIEVVRPAVIVTLGNFAGRFMLGTTEGVTRLRGREYPCRGAVLVPTFHPAAALRGGGGEILAAMRADLVRAKQALVAAGRFPSPGAVPTGPARPDPVA